MDPSVTDQTSFRLPPEAFNPVHMRAPTEEFILAMIDSEMPTIPDIDQPIVPSPPVRINHTIQSNLPWNHCLQRGFSGVHDEFRVDLPIPLEDHKDNGFTRCLASLFFFDTSSPKVGFIDFRLSAEQRLRFAEFRNACSKNPHIPIHRIAIQSGQEGHL